MMKASSKKSRKKASTKTTALTTSRKPICAAGQRDQQVLHPFVAVDAVESQREDARADEDEDDEGRELGGGFERLAQQVEAQPPPAQRKHQRADRAHRAALGRRGDARKIVPSTRKIRTSGGTRTKTTCRGHARHEAEVGGLVNERQHVENARRQEGAPDEHVVGRHVGEARVEPLAQRRGGDRRDADHRERVPTRNVVALRLRHDQSRSEDQQRRDDGGDPMHVGRHLEREAREFADPFREGDEEVEQRHADEQQSEGRDPFLARRERRIFRNGTRFEGQGGAASGLRLSRGIRSRHTSPTA